MGWDIMFQPIFHSGAMSDLAQVYVTNALNLLCAATPAAPGVKGQKCPRRLHRDIDRAYRMLARHHLQGSLEDFLANPFVRTALSILRRFTGGNYKIQQAVALLEEAGKEATKAGHEKNRKSFERAGRGK